MPHWVIVGASRGIGLEFVKQLVARGDSVTATVRGDISKASNLWAFVGSSDRGTCRLLECDVKSDPSISVREINIGHTFQSPTDVRQRFVRDLTCIHGPKTSIDFVVVNAGILKYPNVSVAHHRPI